jgi:thiaminase
MITAQDLFFELLACLIGAVMGYYYLKAKFKIDNLNSDVYFYQQLADTYQAEMLEAREELMAHLDNLKSERPILDEIVANHRERTAKIVGPAE